MIKGWNKKCHQKIVLVLKFYPHDSKRERERKGEGKRDFVPAMEAEMAAAMGESSSQLPFCEKLARFERWLGNLEIAPCFILWKAVTWSFWVLLASYKNFHVIFDVIWRDVLRVYNLFIFVMPVMIEKKKLHDLHKKQILYHIVESMTVCKDKFKNSI